MPFQPSSVAEAARLSSKRVDATDAGRNARSTSSGPRAGREAGAFRHDLSRGAGPALADAPLLSAAGQPFGSLTAKCKKIPEALSRVEGQQPCTQRFSKYVLRGLTLLLL